MRVSVSVWRPPTFQALRTPGQANTVYQLAISLNNVGRCEEAIDMYTHVRLPTKGSWVFVWKQVDDFKQAAL